MAFSYFYSHIDFNGSNGAQRPVVPVKINGYDFTGLIDSGSDAIVIPKEIAEALELETIDKTELAQLDGSKIPCDISKIELEFGKGHTIHKFNSRVLISDTPRIILGRNGFFNQFIITFDEDKGLVSFKKTDALSRRVWTK